jgi:glutamate synthase (ferredoxin)
MEVEKKSKKDIKSLSNSKVSNLLPLEIGGVYRWRDQAKAYVQSTTISKLQQAVRLNSPESYKRVLKMVNDQSENLMTRGLFEFNNLILFQLTKWNLGQKL